MKTTKNKIVVFLTFLLAHLSLYAQYTGGNSDGFSSETLSVTSCLNPAHFYAYFGGNQDGSSVDMLMNTTCKVWIGHYHCWYDIQNHSDISYKWIM